MGGNRNQIAIASRFPERLVAETVTIALSLYVPTKWINLNLVEYLFEKEQFVSMGKRSGDDNELGLAALGRHPEPG